MAARAARPGASRFRHGDPANNANPHFYPVSFVKASGEWKDGVWTGKQPEQDDAAASSSATKAEGSQQRYDAINGRRAGTGLGFTPAPAASTSKLPGYDEAEEEDEPVEDQLAALLQAFPGSRVLDEGEVGSSALKDHFEPQETILGHKTERDQGVTAPPSATEVIAGQGSADQAEGAPAAAAADEEEEVDEDDDDEEESEDEQILIPLRRTPARDSAQPQPQTMQTDSEEERQLDAIIAAQAEATRSAEPEADSASEDGLADDGPAFTIDLTGSTPPPQDAVVVDESQQPQASFVLGERSFASAAAPTASDASPVMPQRIVADETFAAIIESSDSEDESGFVPVGRQKSKPKGGRKARNAAKKARRRAKKLGQYHEAGDDDVQMSGGAPRRRPRTGDSDIEWGSDGPPDFDQPSNGSIDRGVFQLRDLNLGSQSHADAPRTRADEERMLLEALSLSAADDQSRTGASAPGDSTSYSTISIAAKAKKGKGRLTRRQREEQAMMQDYIEHALVDQGIESDDEDGGDEGNLDGKTDMDALIGFMNGMDPQVGGRQMTMGDIQDEMDVAEEDEWMTESEEGSDGGDSDDERAFDVAERQIVVDEDGDDEDQESESESSDDEVDAAPRSSDDEEDEDESDDQSSSNDDDDDDDDIFDRDFTWADEDEAMISKIDRFCAANDDVLSGRDRKARNRLFKAIENGDFEDFENDDAAQAGLVPAKKKKGRKAEKAFNASLGDDDEVWAEHLQSQWQKDRATKAANKRKRAAERQAAAQNPFPNTHKKGTKKMAKKAARAARRAAIVTDPAAVDQWDEPYIGGGLGGGAGSPSLQQVDAQIQDFLRLPGHTTLSLPPMDKRARARVHILADAYNLTSKSRGSGAARFTTLIKTSRSGHGAVDQRKVNRALRSGPGMSLGSGGKNGKGKGRSSGAGGSGGGVGGGGSISVSRNIEGADVGWGADRIGADNIGHKVRSKIEDAGRISAALHDS